MSERLRGEGAKLIDEKGNRFVDELISRDKLARAVYEKQKSSEVYLTMAHLNKDEIIKKLPNIYKRLKLYGFDLTHDRIPITPAAHYQCGGVTTDLDGKTSVKNLFAVGEVANTGVHGANRLASNSLLEAVVFGKQVGKYLKKSQKSKVKSQKYNSKLKSKEIKIIFSLENINLLNKIETDIKKIMWEKVGIVRRKNELTEALEKFNNFKKQIEKMKIKSGISRKLLEVNNLLEVAAIIAKAALSRHKSLGAHYITSKIKN